MERYDRYRASLSMVCIKCRDRDKCREKGSKCMVYMNIKELIEKYHRYLQKENKDI